MCESTNSEEMSSMGIQPPVQNGAPESFESEYSIIENPQLVMNGHGINHVTTIETDMPPGLSASSDVSLERLQSCIADLAQENCSLRHLLEQNNKKMESQLHEITAWHSNLTTSMSEQQLQLSEAEEKITALKKENVELHNKVLDLETKAKKELSPVNGEMDFEVVNKKEFKVEGAIQQSLTEVAEYKDTDQQTSITNEDIQKFQKRIKELEDELGVKEAELCLVKEHQTSLTIEDIQKYHKHIKTLEDELGAKDAELEEEKLCHSETKKMFSTVQTNYDRVTRLLQIQSKDEKVKGANYQTYEDIERERDTEMYLGKIDDLTDQVMKMEERAQVDEQKIRELTSELETLKLESENVPILQSQVEVYKIDLERALLSSDAAAEEVNRLTIELNERSAVSLCDSCGRNISMIEGSSRGNGRASSTPRNKKPELKQKGNMYICPVCNVHFACLQEVERHANFCIDVKGV